ncbi:MAG: hypothetical protein AB7F89_21260 [Pirellulaceae bacterium]
MKTERRHELQTNKLADWTGHQMEQLRPHGKMILGAAILGTVVIVTAIVLINDSHAAQEQAWNDYYLALGAGDRDALANVAKAHAGTEVAWWALQSQADMDLTSGIAALYTNRSDAQRALDDAQDGYEEILAKAADGGEMQRHALLGLAQVHESRANLDKARETYEKLISQFPGTPEASQASRRLGELKDPQVAGFYTWFDRQQPKPATSSAFPNLPDLPGLPGSLPALPDNLTDLPDRPDGPLLPSSDAAATPSSTVPSSAGPSTPAPSAQPPAAPGEKVLTPESPSAPTSPTGGAPSASAPGGETPAPTSAAPAADTPPAGAPPADTPAVGAPPAAKPASETGAVPGSPEKSSP